MGGDSSRALNAVTTAITAALGGQTDLQAATNALAPYAAQVIGQEFGHGEDKNTAAQMVAHALLGATLAYINGGDPTAGGSAAVASEAAAMYLTKQLEEKYKNDPKYFVNGEFQANLLSETEKAQIRDLTAGIGAVIGGAVGDSTYNAQLAGVIGQNAVENNNLDLPYPVSQDWGKDSQSLIAYGIQQGWSNEKIQAEVNKNLRGKGVEIENKDIVEVLDKTGKVATIIGVYPSPYTKPIGAVGGALGTASILVDNKKTGTQKVFEIFGSSLGSFGSGRALKNVPVSEGVKNAHNTISGEIGGKAGEAMYQCIQNPKQAGC
ncbi:VENN motif pre-toxin domain-containing protein [Acinetobacter sp. YH12126]|uniref:VENN motif pre-toxin domain-containing protein n=1 Tax=Acinetobacter sp. YH12126 TaxID=2601111 RepID=UPI00211F09E9|nr:VENN motif pre-toxin domain-containing protein [Acinetobacter sp. YH12126]